MSIGKLAIILIIFLFATIHMPILHSVFGLVNDTIEITKPNSDINTGGLSNDSGIMHNTTGIIDDAFDALKDSFGSFFGK